MDMTDFQESSSVKGLLEILSGLGIQRLDFGARYPPLHPGKVEELLGEVRDRSDIKFNGCKSAAFESCEWGKFDPGFHWADPSTSLEEQVEGFNRQIELGHCRAGFSNVPSEMLEKMLKVCEEKGLRKPACYQGDYNLVTRGMETRLLPLLRAHNMSFNAFRPLAAGFLTGKLIKGESEGTRFADNNPLGKAAQAIFGAKDLHAAMEQFDANLASHDISLVEVVIRWIAHQSALSDADGIIVGASKTEQILQTASMMEKGPLPKNVLDLAESLWQAVKDTRKGII
ncbi:MAG: hypothetical protein Q9170_002126 [Blastenia crenularia]